MDIESIFNLTLLLAAFGGGLFAAALGPIGAFSLSGAMILVGIGTALTGNADIVGLLAFGQYTGPHIAFASAVGALAYARRMGYTYNGMNVLLPLQSLRRWDVLVVGGLFGMLAQVLQSVFVGLGLTIDTIALTVTILCLLARIFFGKAGFLGSTPKEIKLISDGNTFTYMLALGLGVGLVSSYATMVTGDPTIGFGFSALSLILLWHGDFPVTHHIAICGAYAFVATGSLIVGGVFGLIAAIIGMIIGNIFNKNTDTFIDPPGFTVAIMSFIIFTFM